MRFFRSSLALAALVVAGVTAGRANLPSWATDTIAGSALEAALFRAMTLPSGVVLHMRPPSESKANLSRMIQQQPTAELYGLRARENERAQDYQAAETDWKRAAETTPLRASALGDLADYYHRRVAPAQEVDTLVRLAGLPAQSDQRFQKDGEQQQWRAFVRALAVIQESLLPAAQRTRAYQAWIQRYPGAMEPYRAYLDWTLQQNDLNAASRLAAQLKAAFPQDEEAGVTTDAELAGIQNGVDGALAVYARNFSPLWPDSLRSRYFDELSKAHQLRSFLAAAQGDALARPNDLGPASRLFFYYEQQNRKPAADAEMIRFVSRREASKNVWSAGELRTIGQLFLRVQDYDEAARFDYLLHELPTAASADRESGLASLIGILLDIPEQPLSFGNRDLSLYRNIAQMDRHPGF